MTATHSNHTTGQPDNAEISLEALPPETKKNRRGMKIAMGVGGAIAALTAAATIGVIAGGAAGTAGAAGTPTASEVSGSSNSAPAPAPDLTGTWKQTNSASEDSYHQATITADTISIDWVSDGGDTTSIYWVGTLDAPVDASEPYTWVSERDAAATDYALLASTDATKEFTYDGETISYKTSLMGTTKTIELKKAS